MLGEFYKRIIRMNLFKANAKQLDINFTTGGSVGETYEPIEKINYPVRKVIPKIKPIENVDDKIRANADGNIKNLQFDSFYIGEGVG